MIPCVAKEYFPGRRYEDAVGGVQGGFRGGSPVTSESGRAVSCDGSDRSGSIDNADAVVARVGDVEGTCLIDENGCRAVQAGQLRRAVVTLESRVPVSRDRGDDRGLRVRKENGHDQNHPQ